MAGEDLILNRDLKGGFYTQITISTEKIPKIVDKKSVFPAWHMNKKYWITVVLTAVTDFEKLKALTLRSKELVEKKK